jgi:hypothetical protein
VAFPEPEPLDPKLDVVFKILFADPRARHALIAVLTAVLEPPEPIVDVTVLNPSCPRMRSTTRALCSTSW